MPSIDLDYNIQSDCHDLSHIPGDDGLPLLGNALALSRDTLGLVEQHIRDYGSLSRFAVGPLKGLLVTDPDHLQTIFLDRERNFSSRMGYDAILGAFYGGALIMYDGGEHKIQRRIFQNSP